MDLARHAATGLDQAGDRHLRVLARVRVEARDGGHVVGAERSERDGRVDARRHRQVTVLRGGEDEDGQRVEVRDELAQGRADLLAGAVDVVDDEQRRAPRACRAGDRGARGWRIAGAGGVQHDGAVAVHVARQLRSQPRLPHSASAEDEDQAPASGVRVAPRLAQHVDLGLTTGERRAHVELGRQRLGFEGLRIELGILAQDRVVQIAQRRSGLDADLLDQRRSRLPVGLQRLGLAARAVEREHALRLQSLAQRVARDEHLEFREDLAMAARRQVAVDRTLGRGQVQLLEAADLVGRERLPCDVGERCPAPQRERLARQVVGEERREAQRIDVPIAEAQLVAAPAGDDLRAVAAGRQRLANLRDVELHHLGRRGRRILAPEPSTSRSLDTVEPSPRASTASSARGLPLPIATERLSAVTSTGPRTLICMCLPASTLSADRTPAPKPAQAAIYRRSTALLPGPCSLLESGQPIQRRSS